MDSVVEQVRFPASANQRRMYVLNQLSPEGTEYNVPVAVRLDGNVDLGRLRAALAGLIARHPSLRTSFGVVDEEITQTIHAQSRVRLRLYAAGDDAGVEDIRKGFIKPFDLGRAPLLRACLIRLDSGGSMLVLDLHHIICDGVSVDILIEDLGRLYDKQTLAPLAADYKDFALWQARFATSQEAGRQRDYWLRLLGDDRPVLTLPIDFPRKRPQSVRGDRLFAQPAKRVVEGLRKLAAKNRLSMYMLLLAAYYVLLSKYSGQEDITVGTLVAGRRDEKFQGIVGLFVNTLVLRSQPSGALTFIEYLTRVRDECLGAFENQDYQFEDLVDQIRPPRDLGRTPLFDTMFAALAATDAPASYGGVTFRRHELDYEISKFDLSVTALEQAGDTLVLEFEYCVDLYRRDTVERLSAHYLNLLEDIVADPQSRLSDINILSLEERRRAIALATSSLDDRRSVVDLFRAQVRKAPEAPAVAFGDQTVSYGELDRRSTALAATLRARAVERGDLVGLVAAPSIEAVVAILAVLKLGAAYLPMDPAIPGDRFRAIVADSGLSVVLLQSDSGHLRGDCPIPLGLDHPLSPAGEVMLDFKPVDGDDLAYVIYTSGSTGTPKGVMISHRSLANYITWATSAYFDGPDISFALHSPLSVDLTVTSIFAPLVSGNRIVLYRHADALGLIDAIVRDDRVEVLKLTPSHLALLAEVLEDRGGAKGRLRTLIIGGEDLKTSLAARIHASFGGRVRIFNEYGPTEATVGCMIHRFDPRLDTGLSVSIGKAIVNTAILLLDRYGLPVPLGAIGEIFIAGPCLARGYLNNPRLTDDRFIVQRFGATELRVYKTGDLGRMMPNGTIDYLGRNDDQIKLRGFRIELGEIEATLLAAPQVREAVVTRRLDAAGDPYLCAYVVASGEIAAPDLGRHLARHLPAPMIPARFVMLDRLPIARGGKVDKAALPDPQDPAGGAPLAAAPRSNAENAIAKIWRQVLGRQTLGIDDNFFDLGGQSLKATLMLARVNRVLRTSLSLRDVFASPTIRALGALVEQSGEDRSIVIPPVDRRAHYPVSAAQKRLFIVHHLAPLDLRYNVPFALGVSGAFDRQRWLRAFQGLIARHESLRTSFLLAEEDIVQIVHPTVDFSFEERAAGPVAALAEEIQRFVRPFDLGRAPLMRAMSLEAGPSEHTIIVDIHHIVADGLSIDIVLEDLIALYEGRALAAPSIHYKDYAAWQRARSESEAVKAQGAYWRALFAGDRPILALPTDIPRGAVQSFEGDVVGFAVDGATVEALRAINRAAGATMTMTLLAAYTVLLSKYSRQDDIVVGIPVAGRQPEPVHRVVGMFVNTLATRNRPRGDLTFADYLQTVKTNALDAYSNQEYQFEDLVDALAIERDLSRNPLFDTVFASRGGGRRTFQAEGVTLSLLDFDWKVAKFDLTLLAEEDDDRIVFELEYCTKLFQRATIERLAGQFHHLLAQIARHPERRLDDLDLLSEEERRRILVEFNRTQAIYPADQTIHGVFEAQVEKTPDHRAVVFGAATLSYRELNRRANQVARVLLSAGVLDEQVVGLIAGPSIEMVVGILAILKAGGAYLPIDADCPDDRIRGLLSDSGAKTVLLSGARDWRDETRRVLDLRDRELYQGEEGNLGGVASGERLAYVIYTSGTTGQPKGVMIEHRAVNNLCAWHIGAFAITSADQATKYARFSFDASVWEIFPYLQAGATLHVIPDEIRLDLPELNRYFESNGITVSFLPTQVCELFLDLDNQSLRFLLTGGDRLRRGGHGRYQLINNYGPTENTVVTTSGRVLAADGKITIGKPIANTRVYLLDKADKPVPVGIPGELCIAGAGLARGYLNDRAKTAEKFFANPFEPMSRLYRTGDLARWLADGTIDYLGRIDAQVKIRGCRIEPREVEAVILADGAVKDAVVLAREDSQGNKFLCAYLVWQGAERLADLRASLALRLPDYMMPAVFIPLDDMPLNSSGKIDTAKLPRPESGPGEGGWHVAPRTETERRLAEIWCRVLDRHRIGIHDRFFENGGDSLRATIMIARANKEFDTSVALGAVFDRPTIATLAECFEGASPHSAPVLSPARNDRFYATTPIQGLLYRICSARNGVEYNLPMAFEIRGDLDIARLEAVFQTLIHRHEAFRTTFHIVDERVVQSIVPTVDFAIEILPPCVDAEIEEVARDFIRPFDFAAAPLARVAIVPRGADRHVLLMDMHHLISDGTSMGLLYQQIAALYAGVEPPRPAVTFKDFAEWLRLNARTERMRAHETYWRALLEDPPPAIRLDPDFPRTDRFAFAGNRISFEGEPRLRNALKALCDRQGVTFYVLLLAAYNLLLSKYSGRQDIIVGVPTVGRYIADVHDVLGMFVSTHLIRSRPEAEMGFLEFLQEVKAGVRGAVEHQEYQLWDIMVARMLTTGKALFSTVFIVQDQTFTSLEIDGLDLEEIDPHFNVSKFDLTVGAVDSDGKLNFELEYNTDVFRRATAKRIAGHYLNILEQIVVDPARPLRRFEVVTAAEKEMLLRGFNGRGPVGEERDGWDDDPDPESHATVSERISRQARDAPDRVAVICGGIATTYGALERRANHLAHRLREEGGGATAIVAILARPSVEMICAVLAVWKIGAAFVPIGRTDPPRRVAHILADSGARLLVCDGDIDRGGFALPVVTLGEAAEVMGEATGEAPALDHRADPGTLAYLRYAADSTGFLRGVMVDHGAVADRCRWFAQHFALTATDRSVLSGDLSSLSALFEGVFPLCVGASVWIAPDAALSDGEKLARGLVEHQVSLAWLPAPLCEALARVAEIPLRVLITSSGRVSAERRGSYALVRCFGPVEAMGIATCSPVGSGVKGNVIGKPAGGTQAYILGHDDSLLPLGVSGELCLGGGGLARGYRGDDGATSRRFGANPHGPDERLFRSGLRARWLVDGRLEVTGRLPDITLDGHWGSLAEIERRLQDHPRIAEAVVVLDEADPLCPSLCAFVVPRLGQAPWSLADSADCARHLGQWLPEALKPRNYIPVAAIPRDEDGRLLAEGLPALPRRAAGPGATAFPGDPTPVVEAMVAEVMGLPSPRPDANLLDLGMTSLMAMALQARLTRHFGVAPALCQWLRTPSISDLSRQLSDVLRGGHLAAPVGQQAGIP